MDKKEQGPDGKDFNEKREGEENSAKMFLFLLVKVKAGGEEEKNKVIDLAHAQSEFSRKGEKEKG